MVARREFRWWPCLLVAVALLTAEPSSAIGQTPIDSALLTYINSIRAIDVHAHPMRPVPPSAPATLPGRGGRFGPRAPVPVPVGAPGGPSAWPYGDRGPGARPVAGGQAAAVAQ